ncbi:Zinc finger MYM-type protein 1 [Orchesella cincta]|uniref:Zinc finger MYM-type protein 1 n=1 Tax=Orchesella cincta TaxID=48709 RepID=A0A1D2MSN3_ORCCI|nr:Zinc finger MYM-type protein 1 [Orchesella cincta]
MLATLESEPVTDQLITADLLSQEKARTYLRSIFTTAMFLAQQGMSFRGDEHDNGNFIKLLLLRSKDINGLENWLQRSKSFTSWAIQNEILQIVSHMILRRMMSKIREAKYFSIIVDETSDVSISEQVSISIRIVNELFEPEEYFLGLYETASTTGDSLVSLILDALQRFNLPLGDIRGQCFDGAAKWLANTKEFNPES